MKVKSAGAALGLILLASGSIQAQSWQSIGSPNGAGPQFWNNPSQDQVAGEQPCNIGSVLTDATLNAGSCNAQSPVNLLPVAPLAVAPTSYLSDGLNGARAFQFDAGLWQFTLLGTITGATPVRPWSVNGSFGSATTTVVGNSIFVYSTTGIYMDLSAFAPVGVPYRSDVMNANGRNQFAAFSNTAANSMTGTSLVTLGGAYGATYYVGVEDNACLGLPTDARCPNALGTSDTFSDYDYNDMIISATVVPEPSSVVLMVAGLAVVGFASRRRKA